jgi:hypothetical protein
MNQFGLIWLSQIRFLFALESTTILVYTQCPQYRISIEGQCARTLQPTVTSVTLTAQRWSNKIDSPQLTWGAGGTVAIRWNEARAG